MDSTISSGSPNTVGDTSLFYGVAIVKSNFFKNGYSYIQLDVVNTENLAMPAYISIPKSIANEPHIQRIFEPIAILSGNVTRFDIFIPITGGISIVQLNLYPSGADPLRIDDDPRFYVIRAGVNSPKDGSTLMLFKEDKEKNVRVYTRDQIDFQKPFAEYEWFGTVLPDATAKIENAVVHLTEEVDSNFIDNATFKVEGLVIPKYKDPYNKNKKHLYFFTNKDGLARLRVEPGLQLSSARLIYWPFSDNISEAARFVVYDNHVFGDGLEVPIPQANPISISKKPDADRFEFTISNSASPRPIKEGGNIYIMVNEQYKKTIPSQSLDNIEFFIDGVGLNTSSSDRPASNTVSYIYIDRNLGVASSRKRSFFVFDKNDL